MTKKKMKIGIGIVIGMTRVMRMNQSIRLKTSAAYRRRILHFLLFTQVTYSSSSSFSS